MKDTEERSFILEWAHFVLDLGTKTHVMGILNVTPDSFSDGGLFIDEDEAVEHGLEMARDGADIIDIGGESTRPFAQEVPLKEELARVIPVIDRLSNATDIPISIDTFKAEVAREALGAGAAIINDVSAFRFDPAMASVAAEADVPVVLMHMKGTPRNMQKNPSYNDLIPEIMAFLEESMDRAVEKGVKRDRIILDPGIGFGKTFDHNLTILRGLMQFQSLERPLLVGSSNKAFIGHILNKEPRDRVTGTMATVAAAAMNGAHIVRVHDVKRAVETVAVIDAIKRGTVDQGVSH